MFDNYSKPWCRFQPYLIGILLGYLLHKTKNKDVEISKVGHILYLLLCFHLLGKDLILRLLLMLSLQWLNIILWIVAFGIGCAVVYGLDLPSRLAFLHPKTLSKAENVAYLGLHRLAWGLAVGWLVFACCRGYGGLLATRHL